MDETEYRARAQLLIGFAESQLAEGEARPYLYEPGLDVAREWLRLINAESVSEWEILELIERVHSAACPGSWYWDVALGIYGWGFARGSGLPRLNKFIRRLSQSIFTRGTRC